MSQAPATTLGCFSQGEKGIIIRLSEDAINPTGLPFTEVEKRLIEMGFLEGAKVQLIHESPFGKDPIVLQIDETRVALRRNEANAIWVERI